MVRRRKFPVVGDGGGVWLFNHIADAADATVAAIEHGRRGVYDRRAYAAPLRVKTTVAVTRSNSMWLRVAITLRPVTSSTLDRAASATCWCKWRRDSATRSLRPLATSVPSATVIQSRRTTQSALDRRCALARVGPFPVCALQAVTTALVTSISVGPVTGSGAGTSDSGDGGWGG